MDGTTAPLGATVSPGGVNFSVYSKHASRVDLLFFDSADAATPSRTIPVDRRAYHYWHVFVPGAGAGQIYGYRAHGPFVPADGLRFDGRSLLLDPYGLAVAVPDGYDRFAGAGDGDNTPTAMKSVVADPSRYDWQDDQPLNRPMEDLVIYEVHVGGFTRSPSAAV